MHAIAARLRTWDARLLLRLCLAGGTDRGVRLATFLTRTGDGPGYLALFAAPFLARGASGARLMLLWTAAFAIERVVYKVLKSALRRPRPFESHAAVRALVAPPDRFSFPSGHTSAAFLAAGLVGALVPVLLPALLLWAAAVGASRVLLGVHYPSDVLAGALLGTLVARAAAGLV
ncbi:MAG: phosphatase PAP2 family protein [Gemmatimonadota bacterium]|nr:phosphatase PAP2 family protein [Gemmatimonadota bacterium]